MKSKHQYNISATAVEIIIFDGNSTITFAKKYGNIEYIFVFSSFKNIYLSVGTIIILFIK